MLITSQLVCAARRVPRVALGCCRRVKSSSRIGSGGTTSPRLQSTSLFGTSVREGEVRRSLLKMQKCRLLLETIMSPWRSPRLRPVGRGIFLCGWTQAGGFLFRWEVSSVRNERQRMGGLWALQVWLQRVAFSSSSALGNVSLLTRVLSSMLAPLIA